MFSSTLEFFERFGEWGLFIHSFLDAVIFPIPAFFLQVSISLIAPEKALVYATYGFIGCLIGTPVGYFIGKWVGKPLLRKLLKDEWSDKVTKAFEKNGNHAVLVGAFTPLPFKVFTLMSGSLGFPLWKLIGYAFIGRAFKFYFVGTMFYIFGVSAEALLDRYMYTVFIAIAVVIALVIYLRKKFKKPKPIIAEEHVRN